MSSSLLVYRTSYEEFLIGVESLYKAASDREDFVSVLETARKIDATATYYIAKEKEVPVGILSASFSSKALILLHIVSRYPGKEIGSSLVQAAFEDAKARGISWAFANPSPSSCGFYEKIGMSPGVYPYYEKRL